MMSQQRKRKTKNLLDFYT